MDGSLYDEFGNYIGPDLPDEDSSGSEDDEDEQAEAEEEEADEDEEAAPMDAEPAAGAPSSRQIVLNEDKQYYPTADEVYGPNVENLVMDEDAQPLEQPIIAPPKEAKFEVLEREALTSRYPLEFMKDLMNTPELVRNIAVIGHLHHGKTCLLDTLVYQTHHTRHEIRANERAMRYTDARLDEQTREISIKMTPITLVLENSKGKSYLFNMLDAPGHANFSDEATAALQVADGALLCVDAAEGPMLGTQQALQQALLQEVDVTLCITKIDRLMVELKLPPADAFFKIRHMIEECNKIAEALCSEGARGAGSTSKGGSRPAPYFDPAAGNVAFSSGLYGFSFTLESFAAMYCDLSSARFDPRELAKRLWGNVYFHHSTRSFKSKPPEEGGDRSFVEFVMNPLYKIFSVVLGEEPENIQRMLSTFKVHMKASSFGQDVKPLLRDVCSAVFGPATGLAEMMVRHVASSKRACAAKVAKLYTGLQDCQLIQHCRSCDPQGPLVVYICKLFPKADCSAFDAYGRIFSGTVRVGDRVRVLGEAYTPDDEEDSSVEEVTGVAVCMGRFRIPVSEASAGALVLLEGIDSTIFKTATVVSEAFQEHELHTFRPLQFITAAVVKIATEPLNPSELPKMVEGLRKINKSYPLAVTKVEESGEHTILGTGELYLDSIMKDLREMYADVEVKVADPVVTFCETIVESSSLQCFAETPNKRNKLTMVAEPLDKGLAEDIEQGKVKMTLPRREIKEFLETKYEWDKLAVRGLWAFGPGPLGPNVLLEETLEGQQADKAALASVRESIVQGFQWAVKEGPLADEPLRGVKFKLTEATIAQDPMHRGGGQIIPTARRVLYSAFLLATPRLMEPVFQLEITTPSDCIDAVRTILTKRRGNVTQDAPKPGTPIYVLRAQVPVIESFGLETDIRYHTQGQAFCMGTFHSWHDVPGDPLDKSIVLRPLEPAPEIALAREFMVKTRRRKGMSEDVSINKFFDDPMLVELAKQDMDLQAML